MVLSPAAGAMLAGAFWGLSDDAKGAICAAYAKSRRLGCRPSPARRLLLGIVTTALGPARLFAGIGETPAEVERLVTIVEPAVPERPDRWGIALASPIVGCSSGQEVSRQPEFGFVPPRIHSIGGWSLSWI
jgi:hypothetical protein